MPQFLHVWKGDTTTFLIGSLTGLNTFPGTGLNKRIPVYLAMGVGVLEGRSGWVPIRRGRAPPLGILAGPASPWHPRSCLSLPPDSPLPINSTGRAQRGYDAAGRAEGKEASLPEQVGGGHRCGRGAAAGPLLARLPMTAVSESSQAGPHCLRLSPPPAILPRACGLRAEANLGWILSPPGWSVLGGHRWVGRNGLGARRCVSRA